MNALKKIYRVRGDIYFLCRNLLRSFLPFPHSAHTSDYSLDLPIEGYLLSREKNVTTPASLPFVHVYCECPPILSKTILSNIALMSAEIALLVSSSSRT